MQSAIWGKTWNVELDFSVTEPLFVILDIAL